MMPRAFYVRNCVVRKDVEGARQGVCQGCGWGVAGVRQGAAYKLLPIELFE